MEMPKLEVRSISSEWKFLHHAKLPAVRSTFAVIFTRNDVSMNTVRKALFIQASALVMR